MINRVMGEIITREYYINENSVGKRDDNGNKYYEYTGKPTLESKVVNTEWKEICNFDGSQRYNSIKSNYVVCYGKLNISEDEEVDVTGEILRADLGEVHIHTNKVFETICDNKEQMESKYKMILGKFNKRMIEQDEKMSAYCKLHRWKPEDTDCEELWNLVHDCAFQYIDGKMCGIDYETKTLFYAKAEPTIMISDRLCVNYDGISGILVNK